MGSHEGCPYETTMQWKSWSEFFSMGGYALYVWGSYGVTFVLLGAEVLMLLNRKRKLARRTRPE
jgi:heme exporter protein D